MILRVDRYRNFLNLIEKSFMTRAKIPNEGSFVVIILSRKRFRMFRILSWSTRCRLSAMFSLNRRSLSSNLTRLHPLNWNWFVYENMAECFLIFFFSFLYEIGLEKIHLRGMTEGKNVTNDLRPLIRDHNRYRNFEPVVSWGVNFPKKARKRWMRVIRRRMREKFRVGIARFYYVRSYIRLA